MVIDLSFIIPAKNESDSLMALYQEIVNQVKKLNKSYEIIFIDDGSTDNSCKIIKKIRSKNKRVKLIKHRGNWGKAIALQNGFDLAKGKIIFTLDADLQDNPKDIGKFLDKLANGFDLVVGWKKVRNDPLLKLISTKLFNTATRITTGLKIHDVNCGFKAYKQDVIKNLSIYGDLFRLIPVLAYKQNYTVGEVVVSHRRRIHGKSHFGLERSIKGVIDLLTVIFLTSYLRKPGHFFGGLGLSFFSFGFTIGIYLTFLKVSYGNIQGRQPLLFLGVFLMLVGMQLVTTGLLAEMILNFNKGNKTENTVEQVLK